MNEQEDFIFINGRRHEFYFPSLRRIKELGILLEFDPMTQGLDKIDVSKVLKKEGCMENSLRIMVKSSWQQKIIRMIPCIGMHGSFDDTLSLKDFWQIIMDFFVKANTATSMQMPDKNVSPNSIKKTENKSPEGTA